MQACSTPTAGSSLLAGPLPAHSAPAVPACCSGSRQGAHRTTYAFVRCGGASHIWTQSAPRLYVPLSWLLRMPPTASLIWSKSLEPRCPGRGRPRYLRRAATNSGSEKLSLRPAIMPNHHSLCAHTGQGENACTGGVAQIKISMDTTRAGMHWVMPAWGPTLATYRQGCNAAHAHQLSVAGGGEGALGAWPPGHRHESMALSASASARLAASAAAAGYPMVG